ncbi:hypothetical protein ES703_31062 [subsurface metagenome]
MPQGKQDLLLELDFDKYGLSHLKNTPVYTWQDSDIDKLINAYANENIAPVLYGPAFTPKNVQGLLALSYCRCCGKCCLPNPIKPEHPGVIVSEQDLRRIADNSRYTYKHLNKKAPISKDPSFVQGRYLPLPCMFYDKKKGECQIYNARPLICSTFPVTNIPGRTGIAINVGCDYGKDIYRSVLDQMRKRSEPR